MAHADAQAPESVALRRDDVAQAVVTAVTTRVLQAHCAARQIDLVVRHQHLRGRDLVEIQHARDGAAAAVHERHGLQQPDLVTADAHPGELALVLALVAEGPAMTARELVHEPETRVVARARVLGARIPETDDELERSAWHGGAETKTPLRVKRRFVHSSR